MVDINDSDSGPHVYKEYLDNGLSDEELEDLYDAWKEGMKLMVS